MKKISGKKFFRLEAVFTRFVCGFFISTFIGERGITVFDLFFVHFLRGIAVLLSLLNGADKFYDINRQRNDSCQGG